MLKFYAVLIVNMMLVTSCSSESSSAKSDNPQTNKEITENLGKLRSAVSLFYADALGKMPINMDDISKSPHFSPVPELHLAEHSATTEIEFYEDSVCFKVTELEAKKREDKRQWGVEAAKIKDTGKWGYVVGERGSVCHGHFFVDCTHPGYRNQPWYEW